MEIMLRPRSRRASKAPAGAATLVVTDDVDSSLAPAITDSKLVNTTSPGSSALMSCIATMSAMRRSDVTSD
jgi:hypothetical protein